MNGCDALLVEAAAADRAVTSQVADRYRSEGNESMARLADMKAGGALDRVPPIPAAGRVQG